MADKSNGNCDSVGDWLAGGDKAAKVDEEMRGRFAALCKHLGVRGEAEIDELISEFSVELLRAIREHRLNWVPQNRDELFALFSKMVRNIREDMRRRRLAKKRHPKEGLRGASAGRVDSERNQMALGDGGEQPVPIVFADEADPENLAAGLYDTIDMIHLKYADLSDEDRELLFLCSLGMSNKDIAPFFEVGPSAIQKRRTKLRRSIEERSPSKSEM